jgi:hypothetical protein
LLSKTTISYYYDGTIVNTTTENYFSVENTKRIIKIT